MVKDGLGVCGSVRHTATTVFISTKLSMHLHLEREKQTLLEQTGVLFLGSFSFRLGNDPGFISSKYHCYSDDETGGMAWGGMTWPKLDLACDRVGTRLFCPVSVGG